MFRLSFIKLILVLKLAEGAYQGQFGCDTGSLACLPQDYAKFALPVKNGINEIKIEISVDEVLKIDDQDYSITFSAYFNTQWKDRRITLKNGFGREQAGPGVNPINNPAIYVPFNREIVNDLWLPNIFIYNLKEYKIQKVLESLDGIWIAGDKTVLYSQAAHITFVCPMKFERFPLDTQKCKFLVGSYSYDDKKMQFTTKEANYFKVEQESVGYQDIRKGNTIILDYDIKIDPLQEKDQIFNGGTLGNFSLAGFEMVLERRVASYILSYYLPSALFVIISWISFLIPMDKIAARMILLVALFLMLVNLFNAILTYTPKASGPTAIEVWMISCIFFVFGAIAELAIILIRRQSNKNAGKSSLDNDNQEAEESWRTDKFFLIIFPILFGIFNAIYWLFYLI